MKTLYQQESVEKLISRIDSLHAAAVRQWGRMDVAQMLAHCSSTLDMAAGRLNPRRSFVGRLIGPLVRSAFTNEKPFNKNLPTDKQLVVADARAFAREQEQLKQKIREFHEGGEAKCTRHPHPFFGNLTPQAWSRGMYKHIDHHLRQFGA